MQKELLTQEEFFEDVRQALYAAMLCAYAQGLALIQTASKEYDYNLNISNIARIWRGGCIIRAALLEDIRKVYSAQPISVNYHQNKTPLQSKAVYIQHVQQLNQQRGAQIIDHCTRSGSGTGA